MESVKEDGKASENTPKTKPIILAVDDEFVIRDLIQRYLTPLGYEVLLASNGEQALEYLEMVHPDIVLMDVYMPGKGGIQTLRDMKEKHKDLLVIMLTAIQDEQIGQMAVNYGAKDYLTKPIELKTLQKIINTHLLFRS